MKRAGAVIFHPAAGESELEQMVASAREASAGDLVASLRPLVAAVIVVCSPDTAAAFDALGADVLPIADPDEFHFGDTLKRVIREHALDSAIYFGSGSGTLLSPDQLETLVRFAQRSQPCALFNNFYSCDFAVFSDAPSLLGLALPHTDNAMGFLLADSGIDCYSLPRLLETQFDLDTPIDLLLLKTADRGGPILRGVLDQCPLHHPSLQAVSAQLIERTSLVYLVGRVSPATWQAFEQQVACRTAGMIEGRGMKAYADRQPPVLSNLFREKGFGDFFSALEDSAEAAIIDSRPLLALGGTLPSAQERFSSDLYRISELQDPIWSEFTQQALDCSIPILLGGHSLVSGGLHLLSEICWKGRNLPRRLHPDPYEGEGFQHEPLSG
ncbi:hypothetical protein IH601_12415 [Candidatus Bipolaricaulota bacterium]|nr:hypothetical protein [Candidatus Bipolaricaulota bacterium]